MFRQDKKGGTGMILRYDRATTRTWIYMANNEKFSFLRHREGSRLATPPSTRRLQSGIFSTVNLGHDYYHLHLIISCAYTTLLKAHTFLRPKHVRPGPSWLSSNYQMTVLLGNPSSQLIHRQTTPGTHLGIHRCSSRYQIM